MSQRLDKLTNLPIVDTLPQNQIVWLLAQEFSVKPSDVEHDEIRDFPDEFRVNFPTEQLLVECVSFDVAAYNEIEMADDEEFKEFREQIHKARVENTAYPSIGKYVRMCKASVVYYLFISERNRIKHVSSDDELTARFLEPMRTYSFVAAPDLSRISASMWRTINERLQSDD